MRKRNQLASSQVSLNTQGDSKLSAGVPTRCPINHVLLRPGPHEKTEWARETWKQTPKYKTQSLQCLIKSLELCCSRGKKLNTLADNKSHFLILEKEEKIFRNKNTKHEHLIDDILYSPYSREDKSLKDLREKRLHLSLSNCRIKPVFKNPDKTYGPGFVQYIE